jgi:hypothetical protein
MRNKIIKFAFEQNKRSTHHGQSSLPQIAGLQQQLQKVLPVFVLLVALFWAGRGNCLIKQANV